ncbi:MAG: acetate--CoA ligase family protein [Desulfobacterales bacterium]|nr:acetate--CoA ligase family protein [Desulfobacterales bacterium]
MDISVLQAAIKNKAKNEMNEVEAKCLLDEFDVPVVPETMAQDDAEALKAADAFGFPVVVKGLGSALAHKTERGLVHLNLSHPQAVQKALAAIRTAAGDDLEGFVVQPQIQGRRELVAGLFRDPQFGPVIMFGIGGVFTEALADVSFRLAPINDVDAGEMLDEIRAQAFLGPFRGEQAINRRQIIQTLMGLSRIAVEFPHIAEIDINPLLASADGRLWAVDALVVLGSKTEKEQPLPPPVSPDAIGAIFYPKSIAFVGASTQIGKWGHMLMANTISGGYEGQVFLVNPNTETIAGRKTYPSVCDIPDPVDLAVVTIPAAGVLDLIPQLKQKGIKNMLLITSGFGETGEAGKRLEAKLVRAARKAGILILGPNTMGICNPHIHFYCTGFPAKPRAGSTAMVSQSGNMGVQLLAFAEQQGIGIRGFCGSGNEAMMCIEDYLDGLEVDTLTRTAVLYVESVKNGRRFFEGARRVGRKKPIVLLKGGESQAGKRAAASHTGALTSDKRIFDAVCRQAGIVKVDVPMELLDLGAAFSSLPLPKGNRVAIMTLGGGWGVVTADLCARYGLDVIALSPNIIEAIDQILPPYWSRSNPIDLVGERDPTIPRAVLELLLKWDGCDAVINLGIVGRRQVLKSHGESVLKADPSYSAEFLKKIHNDFKKFEMDYIVQIIDLMEKYDKPVFGVSMLPDEKHQTVYPHKKHELKGVFFPAPERAVGAFAKMVEYQKFLSRKE